MNTEHGQYSGVVDIARNGIDEVIRLRSVIKILEQDVMEVKRQSAHAINTRRVLCDLLGECLPLLEYDAQETHCGESHDQIVGLIRRINNALGAVQDEAIAVEYVTLGKS